MPRAAGLRHTATYLGYELPFLLGRQFKSELFTVLADTRDNLREQLGIDLHLFLEAGAFVKFYSSHPRSAPFEPAEGKHVFFADGRNAAPGQNRDKRIDQIYWEIRLLVLVLVIDVRRRRLSDIRAAFPQRGRDPADRQAGQFPQSLELHGSRGIRAHGTHRHFDTGTVPVSRTKYNEFI